MTKLSQEQETLAQTFLTPFETPEQMRDWIYTFFDIDFPMGSIDPDSNSSPIGWLFDAYSTLRFNRGDKKPVFVVYSSRDSYKTLTCSAFEVIAMIHFGVTVAHMAAIEPQSKKAVQYINTFLRKVEPYLNYHNREIKSQNTRNISIKNEKGEETYISVIICTLAGANCVHPDTMITYANDTQRRAADVAPGDTLKTWDYTKQDFVEVVVGSVSYTEKMARELVFEDGSNVVLSDDHQVFTQKGWIPAGKVRLNDKMTAFSGSKEKTTYSTNDYHSPDIHQIISGTLLGDASLYLTKNKVRYQVSHCKAQLGYLHFINDAFNAAGIPSRIIPDAKNQYKLITKTHPVFEEYTQCYQPRKVVTKEWLDRLTWEGIAYWLMDDVRGNGRTVGLRKDHRFQLATCSFSRREHELIVDFFTRKGFECWISSVGTKYLIIEFSLDASRRLSDRISEFFVRDLRYKLLPSHDLDFTRCIKTGELIRWINGNGFTCTQETLSKTRTGRRWRQQIIDNLRSRVVEIKPIGMQKLVDVHIDTLDEHHKSFLANSGKLLHNSEHTNLMCIDEIDVVRFPQAYEEAKMIPGVLRGRHPITVMTSTRKFAFGLMQQEIDLAKENDHPVLHWNILDITEKCPPDRHKPLENKQTRWIAKQLPLKNISEEEYAELNEEAKDLYTSIDAFAGCAKCSLLPVCKTRLATRPDKDKGMLYKPIAFTMNQFKKISPEMAEAQLMCWKPSSTGLVYPRFDESAQDGNVITINDAWKSFTGSKAPKDLTLGMLIDTMKYKGINFYGGVDWGYRHYYAIIIGAVLPNGDFWIFETLAIPQLEFEDQLKYAKLLRDKYGVAKWFADTSMPSSIVTFRKNKMPCKDFKKDVMGGIESIRGQVVDSSGCRKLKIIKTDENEQLIKGFRHHHFKLDAQGRPTLTPDDESHADIMDALRYMGQNLFGPKGNVRSPGSTSDREAQLRAQRKKLYNNNPNKVHADFIRNKINNLATNSLDSKGKSDSGAVIWDFSDPSFDE